MAGFFKNVDQLRVLVSERWRPDFPRVGSLIHQLFANEIIFTDFDYGEEVTIPLATDGTLNRIWDPETGSKSNYASRKSVKAKLDQVIDIQERIGKLEGKALGPNFLNNKIDRLGFQSSEVYDQFDAEKLATGGTVVPNTKPITAETILGEFAKMRIAVVNSENTWTNGFLLATANAVTLATYAKIMTPAPQGVLEVLNGVVGIVNGCITIEVPESRLPEGSQIMWVNPLGYATLTAVDLPFTVGIYTDPTFMGQVYIAGREFFTGKVVSPKMIHVHQPTKEVAKAFMEDQIVFQEQKILQHKLMLAQLSNLGTTDNLQSSLEKINVQVEKIIKNYDLETKKTQEKLEKILEQKEKEKKVATK